jgi:DNA-binding transcriptional regulator YhcF (GntR family)
VAVKPTETRRLYLQIADKLRALIEEQGFAPNGRLPSERELALMLGVSRPSVREALVALNWKGGLKSGWDRASISAHRPRPGRARVCRRGRNSAKVCWKS